MTKPGYKLIIVHEDTWRRLWEIKLSYGYRSFDEIIRKALDLLEKELEHQ